MIFMCKFRVLILESFIVQGALKYSSTLYVFAPEIQVQKDVMHCFVNMTHHIVKGVIRYFPLSSL